MTKCANITPSGSGDSSSETALASVGLLPVEETLKTPVSAGTAGATEISDVVEEGAVPDATGVALGS